MEICLRRSVAIDKIYHIKSVECGSCIGNQLSLSPKGMICPEPRRAAKVPFVSDGSGQFICSAKSTLSLWKNDVCSDLSDMFLNKDDPQNDFDATGQKSFFCGSPPVRTNNPLINDARFVNPRPILSISPLGNFNGNKPLIKDERSTSCPERKPVIRIEGF